MTSGVIGLTILLCVSFFWYFSYGFDRNPPRNVVLNGLDHPAEIVWRKDGSTSINSDDLTASLAALGYVHATRSPWQMMLWRQTALGSLSAWFGPSLLRLDRLNRQLRFSRLSEASFRNLPSEQKRLLEAYAEGVNNAISRHNLLAHDEFAFLGADIHPWKPWHTLAVERLFAWTTTNLPSIEGMPATGLEHMLSTLEADNETLHEFLQLYDFQYSFAGQWEVGDTAYFYNRLVFGASAESIVQEVSFTQSERPSVLVATIPGTLTFLSGLGQRSSWSILPTSDLRIAPHPEDAVATVSYERITNRDGTEFLAIFRHYPGMLSLPASDATTDSTYALHWSGFEEGTDAFSFVGLLQDRKPSFHLFRGDGLLQKDQRPAVMGRPEFTHQSGDVLLVGSTLWTAYIASHLDSLQENRHEFLDPDRWPDDCYNPWAARYAPDLLSGISSQEVISYTPYKDAIVYLRNWDFSYASSSIGAAIFEGWLGQMGLSSTESRLGNPPAFDPDLLAAGFIQTIDSMNATFGSDLSQWRLEKTRPVRRYFSAWTADSLFSPDKTPLSATNYAPLIFPGKGDAATLCNGSFISSRGRTVSAQWEAWSRKGDGKGDWFWRKQNTPTSFLERFLISNQPDLRLHFSMRDENARHTRLIPES